MSDKFNENNIKSIYLTGESRDEDRESAIKKLESGEIKFIFTVDLYNEGIDIPCINVELLLRPTDSLTIFLQQLGRGLRKNENKDYLTVLDFIGEANKNFNYINKLKALIGHNEVSVKDSIENDFPLLPAGCSIYLEKVAEKHILANVKANTSTRKHLVELLQKFEETTGKELTLNNFLTHYKINIHEFYKKDYSFYRLLTEAGIKKFEEVSNENDVISKLKNLFSINSPKFIIYIRKLMLGDYVEDELLFTMTYYTFYNKIPIKEGFISMKEALQNIKSSKCLNFEVNQICDYLYNNLNLKTVKNDLSFYSPLEVYGIYNQAQIYSGLGVFNAKYSGPMLQGVWYLKEKNHDIFLCTLNKEESHFGESISYNDYPINEELFSWQTQNSVSTNSEILNRYIHSDGRVSLFVRINRKEYGNASAYMYLGEAKYISCDGSKPVTIVWKLNNKIPAEYLLKMKNID